MRPPLQIKELVRTAGSADHVRLPRRPAYPGSEPITSIIGDGRTTLSICDLMNLYVLLQDRSDFRRRSILDLRADSPADAAGSPPDPSLGRRCAATRWSGGSAWMMPPRCSIATTYSRQSATRLPTLEGGEPAGQRPVVLRGSRKGEAAARWIRVSDSGQQERTRFRASTAGATRTVTTWCERSSCTTCRHSRPAGC
jgi:hypothetical protein